MAAVKSGLNVEQLQLDVNDRGKAFFEEDLELAKTLNVRGFPTMIFDDNTGNREVVYGSRPYAFYETTLLKLYPKAEVTKYVRNWEALFLKYPSLTAKEYSELSGTPRQESETVFNDLTEREILEKETTKNGAIWKIKKS